MAIKTDRIYLTVLSFSMSNKIYKHFFISHFKNRNYALVSSINRTMQLTNDSLVDLFNFHSIETF